MKVGSAPKLTSKSSTLADDVFEQLRASIVKGELTPGSKINEPQLSKQPVSYTHLTLPTKRIV